MTQLGELRVGLITADHTNGANVAKRNLLAESLAAEGITPYQVGTPAQDPNHVRLRDAVHGLDLVLLVNAESGGRAIEPNEDARLALSIARQADRPIAVQRAVTAHALGATAQRPMLTETIGTGDEVEKISQLIGRK